MNTRQLREQANEAIIQALEQEMLPWRSDYGFPKNVLSRRRYGGIEAVLLMLAGQRQGFASCFWGTRSEWETLGGKVKGGSGTQIVVPTPDGLRSLTFFNLSQVDGNFPVSRNVRPTVDYALVERVIANTGVEIRFTDERIAEYHYPQEDGDGYILICRREHFERGPCGCAFILPLHLPRVGAL